MGEDDVRGERGQFRRVFANFAGIGRRPAGVDPHVVAELQPNFCSSCRNAPTQV